MIFKATVRLVAEASRPSLRHLVRFDTGRVKSQGGGNEKAWVENGRRRSSCGRFRGVEM